MLTKKLKQGEMIKAGSFVKLDFSYSSERAIVFIVEDGIVGDSRNGVKIFYKNKMENVVIYDDDELVISEDSLS